MNRILIVGGGIGGLTLAAALRSRGIESELIEQAPAWEPVGAGITLGANAMRVYEAIGLAGEIERRGLTILQTRLGASSGKTLTTMDLSALAGTARIIGIHRAELHEALLGGVDEWSVRLGMRLKSIGQKQNGDDVEVEFSDGTRGKYELVVGADGIRSQVRDLVFGQQEIEYSGYTCWRFLLKAKVETPSAAEIWGRGRRFGIITIGEDLIYCFATLNTEAVAGAAGEMANIGVADFKAIYKDFAEPVAGILAQLDDSTKLIHGDLAQAKVPRWIDGRVALLGDAAHAMTPNLGQGAAMAIEDAAVLAECLAKDDDVEAGLRAYAARRMPRATSIQKQSWNVGRMGQLENPVLCSLRDLAMRVTPERVARKQMEGLFGYEA